jgi:transcriptional regulator with PAS, ATPase and Fis domain
VLELMHRFLRELGARHPASPSQLTARAAVAIAEYAWPGNVRQLRNVLERALVLGSGVERLDLEHLPEALRGRAAKRSNRDDTEILSLQEVERRHVERVLYLLDGNRTAAAEKLGISRSTLHAKISQFGLEAVGQKPGARGEG